MRTPLRSTALSIPLFLGLAVPAVAGTIFVDDFDDENGPPTGWTLIGTATAVETAANSSVVITGDPLPNHARLRSDAAFTFAGTTTELDIEGYSAEVLALGMRDTVDGDALFIVFENGGDRLLATSFSDGTFNFSPVTIADGTGYAGGALQMAVDVAPGSLTVTTDQPFFDGGTTTSFTSSWIDLFGSTNGFDPSQIGMNAGGYQLAVRDGTAEVGRIELSTLAAPIPEPPSAALVGAGLVALSLVRRRRRRE